ncbi:uncharacterized protein LOC121232536 [Aquila chrysaetos chrysaetos]|uniref:uncharacterized protein LOC121232536 n=1 Tax=Aquila chrysaetos chrysaetos TaxID=223781 RepID=UPI001B7D36B2|nr:uncharacterized protein LOC121232536 [Aquila chrysaetos chrysaetos]
MLAVGKSAPDRKQTYFSLQMFSRVKGLHLRDAVLLPISAHAREVAGLDGVVSSMCPARSCSHHEGGSNGRPRHRETCSFSVPFLQALQAEERIIDSVAPAKYPESIFCLKQKQLFVNSALLCQKNCMTFGELFSAEVGSGRNHHARAGDAHQLLSWRELPGNSYWGPSVETGQSSRLLAACCQSSDLRAEAVGCHQTRRNAAV